MVSCLFVLIQIHAWHNFDLWSIRFVKIINAEFKKMYCQQKCINLNKQNAAEGSIRSSYSYSTKASKTQYYATLSFAPRIVLTCDLNDNFKDTSQSLTLLVLHPFSCGTFENILNSI